MAEGDNDKPKVTHKGGDRYQLEMNGQSYNLERYDRKDKKGQHKGQDGWRIEGELLDNNIIDNIGKDKAFDWRNRGGKDYLVVKDEEALAALAEAKQDVSKKQEQDVTKAADAPAQQQPAQQQPAQQEAEQPAQQQQQQQQSQAPVVDAQTREFAAKAAAKTGPRQTAAPKDEKGEKKTSPRSKSTFGRVRDTILGRKDTGKSDAIKQEKPREKSFSELEAERHEINAALGESGLRMSGGMVSPEHAKERLQKNEFGAPLREQLQEAQAEQARLTGISQSADGMAQQQEYVSDKLPFAKAKTALLEAEVSMYETVAKGGEVTIEQARAYTAAHDSFSKAQEGLQAARHGHYSTLMQEKIGMVGLTQDPVVQDVAAEVVTRMLVDSKSFAECPLDHSRINRESPDSIPNRVIDGANNPQKATYDVVVPEGVSDAGKQLAEIQKIVGKALQAEGREADFPMMQEAIAKTLENMEIAQSAVLGGGITQEQKTALQDALPELRKVEGKTASLSPSEAVAALKENNALHDLWIEKSASKKSNPFMEGLLEKEIASRLQGSEHLLQGKNEQDLRDALEISKGQLPQQSGYDRMAQAFVSTLGHPDLSNQIARLRAGREEAAPEVQQPAQEQQAASTTPPVQESPAVAAPAQEVAAPPAPPVQEVQQAAAPPVPSPAPEPAAEKPKSKVDKVIAELEKKGVIESDKEKESSKSESQKAETKPKSISERVEKLLDKPPKALRKLVDKISGSEKSSKADMAKDATVTKEVGGNAVDQTQDKGRS